MVIPSLSPLALLDASRKMSLPDPPSQSLLGAFARPKPDAPSRPHWNLLHHSLGRLTMLSAWITVCMGAYMAHTSPSYQVGSRVALPTCGGGEISEPAGWCPCIAEIRQGGAQVPEGWGPYISAVSLSG